MSTKQTTNSNSSLSYNPASLGLYNSLTKSGGGVLNDYMNNPLNNGYFNLGQGMGQAAAQRQTANRQQALQQNMKTSGIGGNAGGAFSLAQMAKIGRDDAMMRAQSTMANVQGAFGRQMQATGMGMSFNPLLTGESSKTTQQTGGLGTWLPQLIGTAAGAAMGGFGGMAGMGGSSIGKGMNTTPFGGGGAGSFGGVSSGIGGNAAATFGRSTMPTMNPLMFGMN